MRRLAFPARSRRRLVLVFAGVLAGIPATLLALFYWWLLPNLPSYKDDIASLLSSATGYTIELDKIEGEWGRARPFIYMEGVRVSDQGRPILYFSRINSRFGWRTLYTLEPTFHELSIEAPALTIRRSMGGLIHVGGVVVDPNSPDTSFSDWLLKQGEVRIQGATLAWMDDKLGAQPLVMRNVHFQLNNLFNRHAFSASMEPPAWLSRRIEMSGVMHGRSLGEKEDWHGNMRFNFPAFELSAWRPWLPGEFTKIKGHGSAESELAIYKGKLASINSRFNIEDFYASLPAMPSPLNLFKAYGEAGWSEEVQKTGTVSTVYARKLSLWNRKGSPAGPFEFSLRMGKDMHAVAAKNFPVGKLASMADDLPLSKDAKNQLRSFGLSGLIDSLQAEWEQHPGAEGFVMPGIFKVDARFTGLGWQANGSMPGASNLDGSLAGNEEKGTYQLSGSSAGFDFPEVFHDPAIRFDSMNLRGRWKQESAANKRAATIQIDEAFLANPDLTANLHGSYLLTGKGPGVADLTGRVERADGKRVVRYLPRVINANTHEWLRSSVLQGQVSDGSFILKGDLSRFPFKTSHEGIFKIKANIKDARLDYAEDFPAIDGIDATLVMDGVRLEVRSDSARIYGARLSKVSAVIPDFETSEELLEILGEASGPASEFIRFVNFSPVADKVENVTDEMTSTGDMHLALNMKIPLRHSHDLTVAGRLAFMDDTIFPGPDMPRIEKVKGVLEFTEKSLGVKSLTAQLLGGPASMTAATQDGQVHVRAQGNFRAEALGTWLGKEVASRLSGQSDWAGDLYLGGGKARMRFESGLNGLSSRLPAPLLKGPGKSMQFVFEQQMLEGKIKWSNLQYGNIASAVWTSAPSPAGYRLDRGELRFGDKAGLPDTSGLQITGNVGTFDLGGWVDILPDNAAGEPTVDISGINLTLSRLNFLNRRFNDITISAKLRGNLLRAAVAGKEMAGNLTYRRSGEGPTRLSAQFKHFTMPDVMPGAASSEESQAVKLEAEGFPAFDLTVDNLKLGTQPLGKLDAIAHGVPGGMAIDQLNLSHADSVIKMNGIWKDTGKGETRVKVSADIKNIGLLLARFGFPDMIKRGSSMIEGEVAWQGSPADFAFRTLDGTLKLNAKGGQFLKVDPGAGKLLGVASLQSLPRRITLDFRDVFSQGFAFDEISSTMQLASGDLYTNDFLMKGPAATVKMSGVASLNKETVKLRVKVIPKLSEGVAVAGALLGGPVAGLGALVVQKVLKDPVEEAISFEYLVDGKWDKPEVTKLVKPKIESDNEP